MMLPWVVTLIPSYIIYRKLGWLSPDVMNGYLPLIIPSLGANTFFIFLFRQFLMGIPRALDEAAEIDGCGKMGILFRILLPQCLPILATMIIFSFNTGWSDYVGPSIYIVREEYYTLSIALAKYQVSNSSTPWHTVMAGCLLFSLPMVIVMFSAQGAFQRGIVTSGLKG
jgi:multiple sugar transport system permease protein